MTYRRSTSQETIAVLANKLLIKLNPPACVALSNIPPAICKLYVLLKRRSFRCVFIAHSKCGWYPDFASETK